MLALLKSGDNIIAVENSYSWSVKFFNDFLPKFGITTTFISGTDLEELEKVTQPKTRIIFLESPSTFSYELQDLKKVAKFARSRDIVTIIDNSYCSPLYQQPIAMGIDLVAQSATKYIGGHSDVVAGVLTGSKALLKNIFDNEFMNFGPALSPNSAWLLLRGLRTLPLRLERSFESTKIITAWLSGHEAVQDVKWPFSPDNKQLTLANEQMKGCGGLFSFTLKNSSLEKIEVFCNNLKHILLAVSWGGHESLIVPAIATFGTQLYDIKNDRQQLIRMYVGLEDPQYLIADLQQALTTV
jgi:cystathionine beta-lyase/cystathionine gamma-synthase